MAPKRKLERKTGIHTLDDTPSKRAKTKQTPPKATGLHTLVGSDAKPRGQSTTAVPKKTLRTLADLGPSRHPARLSRGGRLHGADDEDDDDYVEDGATLDSEDENLIPGLSSDARGTKEPKDSHDAGEDQIDTEGLKLETRSQSKAAARHEKATRAKFIFLERLSRSTGKVVEKGAEADDNWTDGVDKERYAES